MRVPGFLTFPDCTILFLFQKLCLKQQLGLSSMALQCPWLREVDLTECESLTDSVCDVFSDGGGCPKLNSLTLDNCDVRFLYCLSSCYQTVMFECMQVNIRPEILARESSSDGISLQNGNDALYAGGNYCIHD